MRYRVKEKYFDQWYGSSSADEIAHAQMTGYTREDIIDYAIWWSVPVEELMGQLEEIYAD